MYQIQKLQIKQISKSGYSVEVSIQGFPIQQNCDWLGKLSSI
jgi:hypothetical protein